MTVWTWEEATTLCNDLVYANKTDWRLPSIDEISSILLDAYESGLPVPFDVMENFSWWVRTLMPGDTSVSYSMQTRTLNEYNTLKISGDKVLPVRAGNFTSKGKLIYGTYVEPRFTIVTQYQRSTYPYDMLTTSDHTVLDNQTGLIWVKPGSWWEIKEDNYTGVRM